MRKYLYIYIERERGKILLVGAYRNTDLTVKELEIGWRHKYYLPNVHTHAQVKGGTTPTPTIRDYTGTCGVYSQTTCQGM